MLAWIRQMWSPAPARRTRPRTGAIELKGVRAPPPPPLEVGSLATYPQEQRQAPTPEELSQGAALSQRVIEQVWESTPNIPPFPSLAAEVFSLVEKPDFDVMKVVAAIRKDSSLSAEVVRMANAAFFTGVTPIESIREAVVRLGGKSTAQAVAAATTKTMFSPGNKDSLESLAPIWKRLWKHSLITAVGSAYLALTIRKGSIDRVFLGGLLHDVGKGIAMQSLSELVAAKKIEEPSTQVSEAMVEAAHAELGGDAADHWKLSPALKKLCTDHHQAGEGDDVELHIVRLISGLDELRMNPRHPDHVQAEVDASVKALELNPFQMRALVSELAQITKRVEAGG